MRKILVTGGAGYIGSHVCKALKNSGFTPITFDNLSHGNEWALKFGPFFHGDLQNFHDLDQAFAKYRPEAVIHLAGSIHLRESIENPHKHYFNNVVGTLSLLNAMVKHQVTRLVYSSSAAVYAPPQYLPLDEKHPKDPINPYGKTKWMTEQIFQDFDRAHGIHTICLRFFNAAGADLEGEIGEAHHPETHLIPRLLFTAQKKQPYFTLYSDQFPTEDGTAIRDYVHVCDLAQGHVLSLDWLEKHQKSETFNLGTGQGYSVLEVLEKAQEVTGLPIEARFEKRKISELPILVADATKVQKELRWEPTHSDLFQILETAWQWHNSSLLIKT